MKPKSAARKLVEELVRQFPDHPAKSIARKALADMPEGWSDLETCRTMVRDVLGAHGKWKRKTASDKSLFRQPRQAGWSDVVPEALSQLGIWEPFEIIGPQKALILSDVHIPFHDAEALSVALEHGESRKPTLILLNGDIADHYSLSRWETDPRQRDFPGEIRMVKFFLAGLRKRFPKARIILKLGNHEERWERYLRLKAPELLGVPEFEWGEVFGLNTHGVELVKDKRPIRLGSLNVIHGHEYVFSISNPVNPARGMYLRAKNHVLGGHFHQSSAHSEKSLEQKVISAWSTGCLCDLHPSYRPLNPWNHGAAFVTVEKDGAFQVDNFRIIDGKAY